ncbi:hypothetical protein SLEP1_g34187 [Rubroshorea leprosula]|uniref:BZIP domain-containing protein n=1 Tax=Rubroshorea leprosula TaxID=152421 RepID=A0AAV5KJ06_9ROSI|nr:hypothetical protein SLEP1_g34187 [Rubroshorea leprosula]
MDDQGNMLRSSDSAEQFRCWLDSFLEDEETPELDKTNQIEVGPSQSLSLSQQATANLLEANNEAGPSNDSNQQRKRGRKAKLTEHERKENKRRSDKNHRAKKKQNVADLERQKAELSSMVQSMQKTLHEALMENQQLQFLADSLNTALQEHRKEVNKIKDCQDINPNCQEATSTDCDLLEDPELLKWLGPAIVSGATSSQTIICDTNAPATEFFRKLDADEMSNVKFQDFTDLDGEHGTVGRYQIPLSLVPTAVKIFKVYGDVCATSKMNSSITRNVYILFCATIKEMGDLSLEQVTEGKMLKWRDAIKDALRIEFEAEFAMEHLKKIACGYFGLKARSEVESIDIKISKLEAHLNGLKKRKVCIEIANEFDGKLVSEVLWR